MRFEPKSTAPKADSLPSPPAGPQRCTLIATTLRRKVVRHEKSSGMEDLIPALWIGQGVTFELNLEEHAKLGFSHGENVCLVAGASDPGYYLPSLCSLFFLDPSTPIFLWDLPAFSSQSVWFVWVRPPTPGSRVAM